VEDACTRFRQSFIQQGLLSAEGGKYCLDTMFDPGINVDKVVGFVFKTCHVRYHEDSSHSDQRYILILKDMVMNSLKHIDAETLSTSTSHYSISAMVQVLQLLANSVDLDMTTIEKNSHRLIECCSWLKEYQQLDGAPIKYSNEDKTIVKHSVSTMSQVYPIILRSLVHFDQSLVVLGDIPVDCKSYGDGITEGKAATAEEEEEQEDKNTDDSIPQSAKLLQDICDRIGFFVTLPSLSLQITAFEALSTALLGLSKFEKQFLPTIHQVWPFLDQTLADIVQRSWEIKDQHGPHKGINQKSVSSRFKQTIADPQPSQPLALIEKVSIDESGEFRLIQEKITQHELEISSSALHLLVPVMQLVSQLIILAPAFISGRIHKNIWPKVLQFFHLYFESYGRIGPKGIDKYPVSLKHGIDSKVKKSIIGLVKNLLCEPALFNLMKDKIKAFYFFMLPWVSKTEVSLLDVLLRCSLF
jgi:hypothetical protein